MRLFEHRDFGQAVIRAVGNFRPRGLRPAIIERDYCVTEVLRAILRLVTTGDQERNPRAEDAKLLLGLGLQRVGRSLLQPGLLDELYRNGQRH
jgi:hypothetical protein